LLRFITDSIRVKILAPVAAILVLLFEIAAAVSQQDAGISQIFGAVSDVNQMMDETISRLEHTGESVDTLRGVSAQVSTVVASFRI